MNATKQVLHWYRYTSGEDRYAGANWYQSEHNELVTLSSQYNISVDNLAGAVSSLSPLVQWTRAKRVLIELLQGKPIREMIKSNVQKAESILKGTPPLEVLSPKTGPKTYAFYFNLAQPNQTTHVTIDTWILKLHRMTHVWMTYKRYYALATAYQRAAWKLSIPPSAVQATLWLKARKFGVEL